MRRRFGLPAQERTADTRVVIVNMNSAKVGIIVDAVSEVLRMPEDPVEHGCEFIFCCFGLRAMLGPLQW